MILQGVNTTLTVLQDTGCKKILPKYWMVADISKLSLGNGIKDNVQVYNLPKFDGHHERPQPSVLAANIKEIEAFSRVIFL